MSSKIIGRTALIAELTSHVLASHAILVYGPRGIGVSTILDGCHVQLAAAGRHVVRIERLASFRDLSGALARIYVGGRSREAIEHAPGVILVDCVDRAGPKVRREIRELAAIGVGAIIAGVADTPREHARLRAFRLAHRELVIPPLDRAAMRSILAVHSTEIATRLTDSDLERVLHAAAGRPGVLVALARSLREPRYWRDGHAAVDLVFADLAMIDVANVMTRRRRTRR